ncbi:hypothetical protein H6G06_07390 [Anabaena sphaerica FACHB-251]|uniref:Calcium-binding protein n=1 Tax=Anabaena sphaerica FACHB-251 TaxID=2692883 RepID=A0A926WF35_9NOST|nr:hypothetical protein [Anabaena sphaerica FACHB-251]
MSSRLTIVAPVNQGTNTIKFGVADTGDQIYDSGLFIANLTTSNIDTGNGSGVLLNIEGTSGNDTLSSSDTSADLDEFFDAGDGDDDIDAGDGDDFISPGPGNDTVNAGPGNDIIIGDGQSTDDNQIDGGLGFDKVVFNGSFNTFNVTVIDIENLIIQVGTNSDILTNVEELQFDDQTIAVESLVETPVDNPGELITGTPGADVLTGGVDFNAINDTVFTGAGDDEVDVPFGGSQAGNNRIFTGSGADIIDVGDGDRSFGGSGDDEIDATDATGYRLSGGAGNDIFYLGADGRALGGEGDDQFYVQEGGGNIIAGGEGADQFWILTGDLPGAANTILDFAMGTDVLGIAGQGAGFDFTALTLSGNSIMIGATTIATLNGVDTTSLTAANFAFM